MARTPSSPQEIEEIAAQLRSAAETAESVAASMRTAGVEELSLHGVEIHTRLLPKLNTWARRLKFDSDERIEAIKKGKRDHVNRPASRKKVARKR